MVATSTEAVDASTGIVRIRRARRSKDKEARRLDEIKSDGGFDGDICTGVFYGRGYCTDLAASDDGRNGTPMICRRGWVVIAGLAFCALVWAGTVILVMTYLPLILAVMR